MDLTGLVPVPAFQVLDSFGNPVPNFEVEAVSMEDYGSKIKTVYARRLEKRRISENSNFQDVFPKGCKKSSKIIEISPEN